MKKLLIASVALNVIVIGLFVVVMKDKRAVEETFVAKIKACDPTYFTK